MFKFSGQVVVLVGLQFGDEGKGKLVDLISSHFDYVVRYQGGDNAGHTIYYKGQKCVLRSVPSGVFHTSAVIAPGTVVNPFLLLEEIAKLEALLGDSLEGKLLLANQSNVICDFHLEWDKLCEQLRGAAKIGSTLRGIGPAYADKSARIGLKFMDLTDKAVMRERLKLNLELKNPIFQKYGFNTYELSEVIQKYSEVAEKLKPYLIDYYSFIAAEIRKDKTFLLEGSQGILLDIDLGTYPFVTSSNIVSSVNSGAFFPGSAVSTIIGVVKVYLTRVGEGPLVTELTSGERQIEEIIRERGHEYGSNTQRARRIGWLDLNLLKYSIKIGGITELALTMVDVFNQLDSFKVCIGYKTEEGQRMEESVNPVLMKEKIIPEYRSFKAWTEDFSKVRRYEDFSPEFREFVDFLEGECSIPISIISFGKNKTDSIFKEKSKLN
ncbi:adenylosuccinate synthase [Candidatus Mycoplasma haematominutum]|uniref:Adenylosuccinate synthetase n=1 Tax=Candidatus Mycoplasma haematominutum 'Birmingham 1' TaxID=1116213 RepID=G8C2N7_9MOLU|nr:adenylosuccinate synthase [Candidatus Mycoplasma haematominutum]CCE66585.1 adenylosuccinate synthetase [Candidatus Mycoplasma haematominutum 'Birmingham 1']